MGKIYVFWPSAGHNVFLLKMGAGTQRDTLPSLVGSYMDTQPLRSLGRFEMDQTLLGLRHRNVH